MPRFATLGRWNEARAALRSDAGNASIEYALLGAIVGLGLVSALTSVKRSASFNYEKIAFAIGQVNEANNNKKTIVSTRPDATYVELGNITLQEWVYYDDGSSDLVRTSGDVPPRFKERRISLGADGRTTTDRWTGNDGSYSESKFSYVNGNTFITDTTGGCQCTYRQVNRYYDLGNGTGLSVYTNDFVSMTNGSATAPFKQTVTAYKAGPGTFDFYGSYQLNQNGTTAYNGSDISAYRQ